METLQATGVCESADGNVAQNLIIELKTSPAESLISNNVVPCVMTKSHTKHPRVISPMANQRKQNFDVITTPQSCPADRQASDARDQQSVKFTGERFRHPKRTSAERNDGVGESRQNEQRRGTHRKKQSRQREPS